MALPLLKVRTEVTMRGIVAGAAVFAVHAMKYFSGNTAKHGCFAVLLSCVVFTTPTNLRLTHRRRPRLLRH